jgi:hypothetical protein
MNNFLSVKNILLIGIFFLLLIWGGIFALVLTDPSYKLFTPTLPVLAFFQETPNFKSDLTEDGPWKQDLFMGTGTLSGFDGKSFLAHGVATPSAIFKNNDVIVYFNYYPSQNRKAFGSINWIKSSDLGRKWTKPAPIVLEGLPELSTNPLSPKLVVLPSGKIKLYFLAKKIHDTKNKLMAALSNDGVNFIYDPTTSFEIEAESLTTFSLTVLNDRMHLFASTEEGLQTGTAYNAISYDTKIFTRLADVQIGESFYGQNSLITEGDQLKLIGASNKGLWTSSSTNGNSWSQPNYLNFNVENPTAVFIGDKYLLFYTANATTPEASN